jgi:4a-hydroxytetrahydrobiopterin dehydratase
MKARIINADEISEKLISWKLRDNSLEKTFQFVDFKTAFDFMTKVAVICDKMNHHPTWTNTYNKVHIKLQTHDQTAVTELDLQLALEIDLL